jgi:ankyrin repeat protein
MFVDFRAFRNGESPLFVASREGHVSCVEALISAKADVLQCNS